MMGEVEEEKRREEEEKRRRREEKKKRKKIREMIKLLEKWKLFDK